MTSLATPDSPLVWEAVSAALTGRSQKATERARNGSPSRSRHATSSRS